MKKKRVESLLKTFDHEKDITIVQQQIDGLSNDEKYQIVKYLRKNRLNPTYLEYLIQSLFEDSKEYASLLCYFCEKCNYNFSKVISLFKILPLDDEVIIDSLIQKLLKIGKHKGSCGAFLFRAMIEQVNDAQKKLVSFLKSNNKHKKKCALRVIFDLTRNNEDHHWDNLLREIYKIFTKNFVKIDSFLFFSIVQYFFEEGYESSEQIIIDSVDFFKNEAASEYVLQISEREIFSISALKIALEYLELNNPFDYYTEDGLCKLYVRDKDFVLNIIKTRLHRGLMSNVLLPDTLWKLVKIDQDSLLDMIESEILEGNIPFIDFENSFLCHCFKSRIDWILWCKIWYNHPIMEEVVLRSINIILESERDSNNISLLHETINLVKKIALKHSLNYDKLTNSINFGKSTESPRFENAIKAQYVISQILNKCDEFDIDQSQIALNIKSTPNLCRTFTKEWLLSPVDSSNPHFILKILSEKPDDGYVLTEKQNYFEAVFKTLIEKNINITSKKLQDSENAEDILLECEIFALLSKHFKIEPEPKIPAFGKSKIEARIEYKKEKSIIEIASVHQGLEESLTDVGFSGKPRIKYVLKTKFDKQLKSGKNDPQIPVILIILCESPIDFKLASGSIYGQIFDSTTYNHERKIIKEGLVRKGKNGFYDIKGTEIVSGVIILYRNPISSTHPFTGYLLRCPNKPLNEISQKSWISLRNALFGSNLISNYREFTLIPKIGEKKAKLLLDYGIDDLVSLMLIDTKMYKIPGISQKQLEQYQKEAIRIIELRKTGSIKYLNKIDPPSREILENSNIFTIRQLFETERKPDGIDRKKWREIKKEAKFFIYHK